MGDKSGRQLDGEVALVTGGGSGIGLALGRTLAQRGAIVVLADITNQHKDAAAQLAAEHGGRVEAINLDVAEPDAWRRAAETLTARFGGVSILCNNAGVSTPRAPVGEYDPALWSKVIQVNLTGVFLGCDTLLSRMRVPEGPVWILNTASVSGLFATPQLAAYCASKHAVIALSDAIRFERATEQVNVSVLCPGFVNTSIAVNSQTHTGGGAVADTERLAMQARIASSMDPGAVATMAVDGLLAGQPYIFTHPEYRAVVERRNAEISAGFDAARPTGPRDDITALGGAWIAPQPAKPTRR